MTSHETADGHPRTQDETVPRAAAGAWQSSPDERLARRVLELNLVDRTQLAWARTEQASGGTRRPLAQVLVQHGLIDAQQLAKLLRGDGGDSTVGRYELVREVARGGMGVVYEAVDPQLQRVVALKVLAGPDGDSRAVERLVREARLTARLDHPHIIRIHEVGDAAGRHYIAMQLVAGGTLKDQLEILDLDARLRRFEEVVCGVAHAHGAGIVHRDLKPANVLIGEDGRAVVTDFGLARSLDRDEVRLTQSGAVIGTPAYMAPEQVEGQVDRLGPRTDVWALGVMLYELLTGALPFPGNCAPEVYRRILTDDPPPPDRIAPVPRDLGAVCLRALDKRCERRYADAGELAAELARWRAGEPTLARPAGPARRLTLWYRRHWRPLAASAVVVLLVVGALVHGLVDARREARAIGRALDRAVASEQRAVASGRRATASEREARANLAKARRMGHVKTLARLRGEARTLWWTPPGRDAGGRLTGELAHPPTRQRLRAATDATRQWQRAARALIARQEVFARARASLDPQDRGGWVQLQRDVYAELIEGTEALGGLVRELDGRIAARDARLAQPAASAAWRAADARVQASERYRHGLRWGTPGSLEPQVDLAPLGLDSASGLEEFAHRGSGRPVRRGADGRLVTSPLSGIVFVLIPTGRYRIGATRATDPHATRNEGPPHTVLLDAFFLAKTELSQAQWVALGGTNTSRFRAGQVVAGQRPTPRHPVEQVSWIDCVTLLARHGLVLPTERQWEAAARGGTTTVWWTGNDPRGLARAENLADRRAKSIARNLPSAEAWDDGHFVSAPVGSYAPPWPHPFGLHDVVGNVREWCRDPFDERAYARRGELDRQGRRARAADADGPRLRVYRSGAWNYRAVMGRSAYRGGGAPAQRDYSVGCRPARSLTFSSTP